MFVFIINMNYRTLNLYIKTNKIAFILYAFKTYNIS